MEKSTSVIRIGLSGARGRMGSAITEIVSSQKQFEISHRYDSQNSLDNWNPSEVGVVIDFSEPQAFLSILKWCQQNKKPLVSGTTGFSKNEKEKIQEAQFEIPILWAPNMSLGIAFLNEFLQKIPSEIKKWKIHIEETHHQFKKDKPSGTALLLHQTLSESGIKTPTPLSKREGDVHGIHSVYLEGPEEVLSITHTALDRKIFARGALLASTWLIQQKPGLYKIEDCL